MASSMLLFPRILHMGGGASRLLPQVMQTLSLRRPLLVTDPFVHQHLLPDLLDAWAHDTDHNKNMSSFDAIFSETVPDPTSDVVQEGLRRIKNYQPDSLVAIGGGSPIDTAKAMAVPSTQSPTTTTTISNDHHATTLPIIAIPTTAGTGSEVTRFSVITQSSTGEKQLFASPGMQPTAALVDFELTRQLPPRVTADTGIDALVHAVEAFVSRRHHVVADMYCREALRLMGRALRPAYHHGEAREALMRAATLAGSAFNHSSVALVHGMSRPLGAHLHWTHGASNAVLFPTLTRWSMEGSASSSTLARYATVARTLGVADDDTTDVQATARLVDELLALNRDLDVPTLPQGGVALSNWEKLIPTMAEQAIASGSPTNNPRVPTQSEIEDLYRMAYDETW